MSDTEYTPNVTAIRQNNAKFREFYELENQNKLINENESDNFNYENSAQTGFLFQQFLMLRNYRTMISLSLIFVGYFAYRFEFDSTIPKSDSYFFFLTVSTLTVFLFLLNILEMVLIKQRNNVKVILKEVSRENTFLLGLRLLFSLVHPNLLFFRKEFFIAEKTYNGTSKMEKFNRNFNEYLYLFQLSWLFF